MKTGSDQTASGLTKREYIATAAMVALIPLVRKKEDRDRLCGVACDYADALLLELAK